MKLRGKVCAVLSAVLLCGMVLTELPVEAKADTAVESIEQIGYQPMNGIDAGVLDEEKIEQRTYKSTYSSNVWDVYASDYAYEQMGYEQKVFYDRLYASCLNFIATNTNAQSDVFSGTTYEHVGYVNAGNLSFDEMRNVGIIFQISNPQFYFINDIYFYGLDSLGKYCYSYGVYSDFANGSARSGYTMQVQAKLLDWLNQVNQQTTVLAKEQKAHELVVGNTSYELGRYHQSCAGTLLEGKAVCAGYAETFEALCNAAGIETMAVTSATHEWNKVKLYGRWYVVDCTWDRVGTGVSLIYLNKSDAYAMNGNTDHNPESFWSAYSLPKCVNDDVITTERSTTSYIYNGTDYGAVFDANYYLNKYSDLRAVFGNDAQRALAHFVTYGMAEKRQGSADFEVISYKNRYKDLRQAFGNHFSSYYEHYIGNGKAEGRIATGSAVITDGVTVYQGVDYSSIYNYSYYTGHYGDIAAAFPNDDISAIAHFVNSGMQEGRQGSPDFNVNSYRLQYGDLRSAFGSNRKQYYYHYMNSGRYENRIATGVTTLQNTVTVYCGVDYTGVFDYNYYVGTYSDIRNAFGEDDVAVLAHFVKYGMSEGRQGCAEFNAINYRSRYADLNQAFGNQLALYYWHYLGYGRAEGRSI